MKEMFAGVELSEMQRRILGQTDQRVVSKMQHAIPIGKDYKERRHRSLLPK